MNEKTKTVRSGSGNFEMGEGRAIAKVQVLQPLGAEVLIF